MSAISALCALLTTASNLPAPVAAAAPTKPGRTSVCQQVATNVGVRNPDTNQVIVVLASFAERLKERTSGELALVPNGDLQFVAEPIAKRKLAALGAAKELVA